MTDPKAARIRNWSVRKATLSRWRGPDHPDTIQAGRELAAAHLAMAADTARESGLDDLDVLAVVRTGYLPDEDSKPRELGRGTADRRARVARLEQDPVGIGG